MGQEVTRIKKRIKSVKGAYKVTSAMKLVSTVKLRSYRNKMRANREYNEHLQGILAVLFYNAENISSPFFRENKAEKNLYVIISSTLGLCGSYNQNIFKEVDKIITPRDEAILLGKKSITHYQNGDFSTLDGYEEYTSIKDEMLIKQLTQYITDSYLKGIYKEIHLIYTHYVNPLIFKPMDFCLLPLSPIKEELAVKNEPLFEPNRDGLIDTLTPFYISSAIYSKLLESEVCEHASRSNAMENATRNAEELLDDLKIEFNKARQGAITQEIIEITSASNM